jgi:hypothetical protein
VALIEERRGKVHTGFWFGKVTQWDTFGTPKYRLENNNNKKIVGLKMDLSG